MPKDNFSKQASLYAAFRPQYPSDLYAYIYKHVDTFNAAWDCATGNGQVASVLSTTFDMVYATDISDAQLSQAHKMQNIIYSKASAESSGLKTAHIDLITVGQAIHWFDTKLFYEEAIRVGRENATICYWGYGLLQINEAIDQIIDHFYNKTVGPFWDPERKIIDNNYNDIVFPLKQQKSANFLLQVRWSLDHLLGYLSSWSAVQKYIDINKSNPVNDIQSELEKLWINDLTVTFPIFLKLGKL